MADHIPKIINKIITNLPYPMYWKDHHLIYQEANKAFAKCIGLKLQDIIGKTDQQLFNKEIQSKLIEINAKEDSEIIKEKKSVQNKFRSSIHGKETLLLVHKIPFSNLPGQSIGMLAIYMEMKEEAESMRALSESDILDSYLQKIHVPLNKIVELAEYLKNHSENKVGQEEMLSLDFLAQQFLSLAEEIREKIQKMAAKTIQPKDASMFYQTPWKSLPLRNKSPQKIQVLLVEDNALAANMTTRILEKFNCQVTLASTGTEALEQAHQRLFDLIFMDLDLPDQSGEKIAQEIKNLSGNLNSKVPIIVLTGHLVLELHQRYKNFGIQEVIMKPLSAEITSRLLETYVRAKPATVQGTEVLPAIDLREGTALLNGNVVGARGGLTLLAGALTRDYQKIQSQYDAKDFSALYHLVLALYGGLCYCGAPALREATLVLKQAILERKEDLEPLMKQLKEEVNRFLQEYQNL